MFRQFLLTALVITAPLAAQAAQELVTNGNFQTTSTTSANGNFQITTPGGTYGTVAGWSMANGPTNTNPYALLFRTSAVGNDNPNNAGAAQTTSTAYSPSNAASGAYSQYATNANNSGSREYLTPSYNQVSPVGGNFVALDGDSGINGYLQQNITGLTANAYYQLTFYWAVAELVTGNSAPNGLTEKLKVSFGNSGASTKTVGVADGGFSGWMKETFYFTAQSTSQMLSFLSVGTPNGAPPVALLDGVSITAAPEPTTLAVLGAGLAGLAGVKRLRRRGKVAA